MLCGGWPAARTSSTPRSPPVCSNACGADPEEDETIARLSQQERQVLALLAEGLTNRQIAERLYLAEKTIKNYVTSVLAKMGMARRTEAAVYAAKHLKPEHE